ncbi:MAG: hypothetical protein PS018_26420 [bacterium]|nr:hypothetical protein [bacterium]
MDPKAIEKCHTRLRHARKSIAEMETCTDFVPFSDAWVQFLQAWKGVFTQLEQGAKNFPASRQWYGTTVKTERKDDPLLRYLFASRDDEEHSLERPVHEGRDVLFSVKPDTEYEQLIRNQDGMPVLRETATKRIVEPEMISSSPAALHFVTERGGNQVGPPLKHLGSTLSDISAIHIAKLGLAYVENLVKTAESMQP